MEYHGKLYGKIGNKYFDTGNTSADFDNAQTQIEKLEADKAELLNMLADCQERLESMNKRLIEVDKFSHLSAYFASKLNYVIQKHKQ